MASSCAWRHGAVTTGAAGWGFGRRVGRGKRVACALLALVVAAPALAATGVLAPGAGRRGSRRLPLPAPRRRPQVSGRCCRSCAAPRRLLTAAHAPRTRSDSSAARSPMCVQRRSVSLLHAEPDGRGIVLIPVGRYGLGPQGGVGESRGPRDQTGYACSRRTAITASRQPEVWLLRHRPTPARATDRRPRIADLRPRPRRRRQAPDITTASTTLTVDASSRTSSLQRHSRRRRHPLA